MPIEREAVIAARPVDDIADRDHEIDRGLLEVAERGREGGVLGVDPAHRGRFRARGLLTGLAPDGGRAQAPPRARPARSVGRN
ncbi:MAG: hypothetical protein IT372_17910 [Polyangiaceae bacterium]|nr:hypothetical protein [Polyangiaceae bacterium]